MSGKINASDKNIRELVDELSKHLQALGYKPTTIAHLNVDWKRLMEYAEEKNITVFSMELGRNFVWERCGFRLGEKDSSHTVNRAIHMLSDFEQYGMVFKRSRVKIKEFSESYKSLFEGFLDYLHNNGIADSSICTWRSRLYRLEHFLLNNGITKFGQIERQHIFTYVESLMCFSSNTVGSTISTLRKLFDYAIANDEHQSNFIESLPDVRRIRKHRLPNVFKPDEIERILASIDKNNEIGKRDYAILLIVAKIGLRIGDVRNLRFDNIDWQSKTISIIQHKTGIPMELPLFEDIGWAIIDYLRNGRPETECKNIFVRHQAPYAELSGNLQRIVVRYVQKAGVQISANKPIGMHTFRHSVATTMLKNGATYTDIAQMLGHATPESAEDYISLDEEQLRKCALEVTL